MTFTEALRRYWQAPLLVLAAGMLASALAVAVATAPDPEFTPALDVAERLITEERYEDAIALLNERVHPYVGGPELPESDRRRFHILRARAIYGGNHDLDVPQVVNDENLVAEYSEAERRDAQLLGDDVFMLADSLVSLGMYDRALERAASLVERDRALHDRLNRRVISAMLDEPAPLYEEALRLLSAQLSDGRLPMPERLWSLARQAEVRIAQGYFDETINQLLRELPTLPTSVDPGARAELQLALGEAYLAVGVWEEAERVLVRVDRDDVLSEGDPRRTRAKLLLAHVDARMGDADGRLESARDRYQELVERYGGSAAYLPGLLGLGETESALGRVPESVAAYETLVDTIRLEGLPGDPSLGAITSSLLSRYSERAARGDVDNALRFATLAGDLLPLDELSPEALEALGRAHRSKAMWLLGVEEDPTGGSQEEMSALSDAARSVLEQGRMDPATEQQVKRHLIQSAGFFRTHADRFILDDFEQYADSLWTSAALYDRAGDKSEAIRAFEEFVATVRGDGREVEARFRLGQAFRAKGEYTVAAGYYRELIEDYRAGGVRRVGQWADASHVPLAQCYIQDAEPENDAEAEELLLRSVDGTLGGPGRVEFMEALFELGRLYYRTGRHAEAIERFNELLARSEGGDQNPSTAEDEARRMAGVFLLADSHRLLADELRARLREAMQDRRAREMRADRVEHLRSAIGNYERARDELESLASRRRTPSQAVHLRNAHFYLGDCAFDLEEYETAIAHYTSARTKYPQDPAVLVALTQIVSAYIELGDLRSARTANERAVDFYRSLPDEVWADPSLPMGRREWERWLESSARLHDELAQGG